MKRARTLCLAAIASLGLGGCGLWSSDVTRVYAGHAVEEHYIPPEAYAHYTQAAIFEASGRDRDALLEYERAAEEDSDSADIWTRLGAVHCRLRTGQDAAMFQRAESIDSDFEPLSRERARCLFDRGEPARAAELARRAVALDPDDEAASLVLARALAKSGQSADARRWLTALVLRNPSSAAGRRALAELAGGAPSRPAAVAKAKPGDTATLTELDRALSDGDAARARRLAQALGVPTSTLALRAAALGRADLARAEAERVLAADPDDADAFVAAVVAASLDHDEARLEALTHRLGSDPLAPSPLAVRLLGEVIARRIGRDASRAWRESWAPLPEPRDPLEAKVESRAAGGAF